ncbi:neuropeptide FF receptor 2-like [Montipora capricornis]|uniref:neuropeptide FF receptor 2-like n=1 Tax=Montipora foliosa TaxID=591990 RepID=UPI0035F174C5
MVTSPDAVILAIKTIIFFASIAGNLLVGYVVFRNREMRTPFNFLLVNLAAADIFQPCFLLLQFIVILRIRSAGEMPGNAICAFLNKTAWTGAFAGVFTMVIIARERYYTVVHPHGQKGKITARTLRVIIPCTWILAAVLCMRGLVLQAIGKELAVRSCDHFWTNETLHLINDVIWATFLCLSFILMVGFYSIVVYTLWFKLNRDKQLTHQQGVLKVRKRVTLMVLIISFMFEISWITDVALHIIVKDLKSPEISIAHVFIMFNSAVNPFVYALLSQRFREKMKGMIFCRSHPPNESISPTVSHSSRVFQQLALSYQHKSPSECGDEVYDKK